MVPVGSNGKDCGKDTYRVTKKDHGVAGAEEPRQDVGDTVNGRITGGIMDSVGGHIHCTHAGEDRPVGGTA